MHPNLSPHLHTPECNEIIQLLKQCHQNTFQKYLGACNDLDRALNRCLKWEVCFLFTWKLWLIVLYRGRHFEELMVFQNLKEMQLWLGNANKLQAFLIILVHKYIPIFFRYFANELREKLNVVVVEVGDFFVLLV